MIKSIKKVKTIIKNMFNENQRFTYSDVLNKYKIDLRTLVVACEELEKEGVIHAS